jgi:hypothetical protein
MVSKVANAVDKWISYRRLLARSGKPKSTPNPTETQTNNSNTSNDDIMALSIVSWKSFDVSTRDIGTDI